MKLLRVFFLFSLATTAAMAQTTLAPLAPRVAEVLQRASNGHSPTPDEISSVSSTPAADAADLAAAVPLLLKALDNSDVAVRTYGLTALAGLEVAAAAEALAPAAAPAADGTQPGPIPVAAGPSAYSVAAAQQLAPAIPQIAKHLTEESQPNRLLTSVILGGFSPNPPAGVFSPLYAFLQRDDANGSTGLAVVNALLNVGPVNDDTAAAITKYLRRSDQVDARASVIDAIASNPHQSQVLNKTVVSFVRSDDPSLQARVILSLPQLDLAPDVFADTKSRVAGMADDPGENLQVVNAAKSVAPCWTATRMTAGCPVY